MGPATTMHMLLGAIVGWGVLSSVAKRKGWAPGPVDDWTTGSKGWIVWVSLAIMLADSFVNLGWLVLRPTIGYAKSHGPAIFGRLRAGNWREAFSSRTDKGYQALSMDNDEQHRAPLRRYRSPAGLPLKATVSSTSQMPEPDAPPEHLVSNKTFLWTFGFSLALCVVATQLTFPIPIHLTILALVLALLLSIMGVRALGETDLNPVSGISKLTQLLFAFAVPKSNPNAVVINLVAGAISEAGALQAGDLMQDLKAGHLLGASPKAQFWGQVIGSAVGAVLSAAVYKLYTSVYKIPGGMFQVPTGYVWVFTARLVTGQGLPDKVWEFALGGGLIFAVSTCARIWLGSQGRSQGWIPGGIAVAVGMYNVPSFTLARAVGGLVSWAWQTGRITRWQRRWNGEEMREGESDELKAETDETPVIVLASGLILGEGLVSIVNLLLASAEVPHL